MAATLFTTAHRSRMTACTLLLAGAAVVLVLLLRSNEAGRRHGRAWVACRPSGACGSGAPADATVSGVSGKLFAGDRQRTYVGPRLFSRSLPAQASSQAALLAGLPPHLQSVPHCSRWAVVTTVFEPSDAIRNMVTHEGWSVVVVGDDGAPPFNLSAPSLVYLDVHAQQQLRGAFGAFAAGLPLRHFGRKNLGYLWAIAHGAQSIWDFDDDNVLKPGVQPAVPAHHDIVRVWGPPADAAGAACAAYNPYPDMGGPGGAAAAGAAQAGAADPPPAWPRGFPLERITRACPRLLQPADASRVAVVQSLADHDPDVDAIFRLTRSVPFYFDPRSSTRTVVLPAGVFAPWNAQATLFLRPAFWSLLLPVTVHGRVSDIWRSYISQRLLWDVGAEVAFAPPLVNQFRSPHNYLADMQAEADLYSKSGVLVQLLQEWRSDAATLPARLEALVIELYERQYLGLQDVPVTQAWLQALHAAGYTFPAVIHGSAPRTQQERVQQARPGALPAAHAHHANWAVLAASRADPAFVQQLGRMPGWHVLVVADSGDSDEQWVRLQQQQPDSITFLGIEQQQALGYAVTRHLPLGGYTRKNVGYLFAIAHGAVAVYDAADSTSLLQDGIPILTCTTPAGELTTRAPADGQPCSGAYTVVASGSGGSGTRPGVFHPQPLFGQPDLLPDALPTGQHAGSGLSQRTCFQRAAARPLVQQALTNVAWASEGQGAARNTQFDPFAFSVVLPPRTFAPLNSMNTVFLEDALWALLLPSAVPAGCTDAVRGVLSQRLLWDIGGVMAVLPATAQQRRMDEPSQGSTTCPATQSYIDALLAWQPTLDSLPGRMLEAVRVLARRGLLRQADVDVTAAWIDDLQRAGYAFPQLASAPAQQLRRARALAAGSSAHHAIANASAAAFMGSGPVEHRFIFPQSWCMHHDKLLVVNFNKADDAAAHSYDMIQLLHAAYRPMFARVVFIGAAAHFPAPVRAHIAAGTFVDCSSHMLHIAPPAGFFGYACAAQVLSSAQAACGAKGAPCMGMLLINDDVIFSPSMLSAIHPNRIAFTGAPGAPTPREQRERDANLWGWWGKVLPPLRGNVSVQLQTALDQAYGGVGEAVRRWLAVKNGSVAQAFGHNQADTYFVPARLHARFAEATQQFRAHGVISEAAVSHILHLLRDGQDDAWEVLPAAFAWEWPARRCVDANVTRILAPGGHIRAAPIRGCDVGVPTAPGGSSGGDSGDRVFVVHPLKLSTAIVADAWLAWWQGAAMAVGSE